MARKNPPLLRYSPFGGSVYIVTRYTIKDKHIIAHEKYDATDDFKAVMKEYLENMAEDEGNVE